MVNHDLTDEQDAFYSEAVHLLDNRESSPDYQHWIVDMEDYDEATSYCWDCLKKILGETPDRDHCGGGYSGGESDSECHCEDCGKLLDYTLTDYGVTAELAFFYEEAGSFDWNNPDDCYMLARIAHGIYENSDQQRKVIVVMLKGQNFPDELPRIAMPIITM